MVNRRVVSLNKLAAEFFGTFALVFAGTGAIIANDVSQGAVTHPGVALTFGLVVLAMIYALGDISGCHLNPAVSAAFVLAKRFPAGGLLPYICAQCAGAFLASGMLRLMFPDHEGLGATNPTGGLLQSFLMEVILTLILMVVILRVSDGSREKGMLAGVAIGAVIALEAMFAGPISGASMNPVRSLAPAIVSLRAENLWIYLTAPVLGALLAVPVDLLLKTDRSPQLEGESA